MINRYCFLVHRNIYYHIFNRKYKILNNNKSINNYYLKYMIPTTLCYRCKKNKPVYDKLGCGYPTHCDEEECNID